MNNTGEIPFLAQLAEGIARREYSLLLGAGASLGGSGGGRDLPTGDGLRDQLLADFNVDTGGAVVSLMDAYEAAEHKRDSSGATRTVYLKARFTGCNPPIWQRRLPTYSWHRVWTLNIDDTVQQMYQRAREPRQELYSVNWNDVHWDSEPEDLQIVHLHGIATEPDALIFSIVEYLQATTAQHAWHRIFGDHFQEQPFIVIGASLRGEFDLAGMIRRGSSSHEIRGLPSYFVAPGITEFQKDFVERNGLIAVDLTADQFFDAIESAVRDAEARIVALTGSGEADIPWQAQAFLEQFAMLRFDVRPPQRPRDFYLGYDPTWYDIVVGKAAKFPIVDKVVHDLTRFKGPEAAVQSIQIISGPWGTGKSAALLLTAREMLHNGLECCVFRADQKPNVEAIAWWMQRRPNTVLFFDGIADFGVEIDELMQIAQEARISVSIIGVERQKRARRLESDISPEFVRGWYEMRFLSDSDINAVLNTLRTQTRLGRITRWSEQAQYFYFARDCHRQLFTAMSELEGGPGFIDRLEAAFLDADLSPQLRDALYLCSFSYQFGYPLPLGVLTHAVGASSAAILQAVREGELGEWMDVTELGFQVRHRHLAKSIVEDQLDEKERYRLTMQLALSLAPRVTRDAIRNRTLAYRIARHVLDADVVSRWVKDKAPSWYAELFNQYGWNARYWEQRALAHLHLNDESAARSYAERAVDILGDPFTRTTLGHVILRQLGAALQSGKPFDLKEFNEAVDLLFEARSGSRHRDDYPYTVFFEGSLRILRLLTDREHFARVSGEIRGWIEDAESSPLQAYAANRGRLNRVKREFHRMLSKTTK